MDAQAEQLLLDIGIQLDAGIFPRVKNGGFVMPGDPSRPLPNQGEEKRDGKREKREGPRQPLEPGARRRHPGQWPEAGGPRQAGRPRPAGQAAPVVSALGQYEQEVGALQAIYPGVRSWKMPSGLWLAVEAGLLPKLRERVLFLIGVPASLGMVRSWAFWVDPIALPAWIGPRHTNFGDGSVCAFEPADGTWSFGDPLTELVDLYTVWALRHLHLRHTGRWPGPQAVHRSFERLVEIRADERCGCASPRGRYGECCRERDLARDRIADAVDYLAFARWEIRKPLPAAREFVVTGMRNIALLRDLL